MNLDARTAIVLLLKGLFYQSDNPNVWEALIEQSRGEIRDYFETIGLEVMCDESEGYAYLQNRDYDVGEDRPPKLIQSRELSYRVSLMCVLLRKKVADFDMQSDATKAVVSLDEIKETMQLFSPDTTNEVKKEKEIESSVKKVVELGFLRKLKHEEESYEIKRSIKAFVDAQWLEGFAQKLEAYKEECNDGTAV